MTTKERDRIKALERQVREVRQANDILRKASDYFAQAEIDRSLTRGSPSSKISALFTASRRAGLVRIYGRPTCIVSDNGTEFTSKAILKWANENGVEWHYINPGKP